MSADKQFNKVVLAYSGGLDTSVMLHWLKATYGCEVICYTADVGQEEELDGLEEKAVNSGASSAIVEDITEEFARDFVFPAVAANAVYEGVYLMGTSLARPLIGRRLAEVAMEHGADAVVHGATGKGNDQIRFELASYSVNPHIRVVAPWRYWEFEGRSDLIAYAKQHDIPITSTLEKPYSIDENLWGCAIECGEMEDLWAEPPPDCWRMTKDPSHAPKGSVQLILSFERGLPVAIDGRPMSGVALIEHLNDLAGEDWDLLPGIGEIDLSQLSGLLPADAERIVPIPASGDPIALMATLDYLATNQFRIE